LKQRNKVDVDGGVSRVLFSSFFNVLGTSVQTEAFSKEFLEKIFEGKESSCNGVLSYLQKGERIINMARSTYEKEMDQLSLSETDKRIFSFQTMPNMSLYDLIQQISRSFVRPCLRSMQYCDDEYGKALLEAVSFPGITVSLSFADSSWIDPYVRKCVCGRKPLPADDRILQILFQEEGYETMCIYGMKNTTHKEKDAAFDKRNGDYFCLTITDLGYFFASLIIYTQVMCKIAEFKNMSQSERDESVTFGLFQEKLNAYIIRYLSTELRYFQNEEVGLTIQCVSDMLKYPVFVRTLNVKDLELYRILCDMGMQIRKQEGKSLSSWRKKAESEGLCLGIENMADFGCCFLFDEHYTFRYHNLIVTPTSEAFYWALPKGYFTQYGSRKMYDLACMHLFSSLFCVIAEEKYEIGQRAEYYRELEKNAHAKSYQLKKGITKKIQAEMENSLFNEYFGFVEFDSDTDIGKAKEISLEFRALKDTFLRNIDASDNAIRFRKLGNHKAAGLYYPFVKCLCVDIRNPDSLVHEFGHLMDYSLGSLSSKNDFRHIKSAYISYLDGQMCNDVHKAQMKGNSKYNYSYYTTPTEIFARCFELYVSRILGVKNSIVPCEFTWVYNQNDTFLGMVEEYFNRLLELKKEDLPKLETVFVEKTASGKS